MNINGINVNHVNSIGNNANITTSEGQTTNISLQTPQGIVSISQGNQAALQILRSLASGATFSADIADIQGSTLTIALKGSTFTAQLLNYTSFNIGDHVNFRLQDNTGDNILLKAVSQPESAIEATMINKSLEMASLPDTERNREMVLELMKNQMPIGKDNLLEMVKELMKYPEASVKDMVSMTRLQMPITEESLKAYSNYENYNSSMQTDIQTVTDAIKTALDSGKTLQEFVKIISGEEITPSVLQTEDKASSNMVETVQNGAESIKTPDEKLTLALENDVTKLLESSIGKNGITEEQVRNIAVDTMKYLSTKGADSGFVNELAKMLTELETAVKDTSHTRLFLQSPNIEKLLETYMKDNLYMEPREILREDAVKAHIVKVVSKMNQLSQYGSENGNQLLNDAAANMKNNMDFLNHMNQFVAAAQIPLKHIGENGEGELYVYKRKHQNSEENDTVKAFLHLDMEHLGPLDVYVTVTGRKASTNFCVADESILDFLEANMHLLNEKLSALGYDVNTEITDKEDGNGGFHFTKEVIEPEIPISEIKRFKFDVKA